MRSMNSISLIFYDGHFLPGKLVLTPLPHPNFSSPHIPQLPLSIIQGLSHPAGLSDYNKILILQKFKFKYKKNLGIVQDMQFLISRIFSGELRKTLCIFREKYLFFPKCS